MFDSLGDRIKAYEDNYNYTVTRRIPIVIRIRGRSFSRLTRNLSKPFSNAFLKAMGQTLLYVASDVQGAVLGYQSHDEITLVLRNDQTLDSEPWYQNQVQEIVSVASSLATLGFQKAIQNSELDLIGDALFKVKVYAVPNLAEAVNCLVWRQQVCGREALSGAVQAELSDKYGKKTALRLLTKKTHQEKIDLLLEHCNIDFEEHYPAHFRLGVVAAKIPTITAGESRNKWTLNVDLPNFTDDRDFLFNILLHGKDVFRLSNEISLE